MSFWDNLSSIMGPGFQTPGWMRDAYSSYGSPITTGTPSASGLYGGDVNYTAPDSPYNSIDPYTYQFDQKKGASKLSADVIRAQYADYMQRFAPIEDFAVGLLRDRGTADGVYDIARARESITNAGMNLQGQQERAMGRYGLNMTGNNISTSNQVTGATVGGLNAARFADEERRLAMLGGGGGGPSMGAQGG
jgi:hypothetical protein